MIPSALVAQLQRGMKDFLHASFWSTTQGFDEMLRVFVDGLSTKEHPLFRGPYVSMKLPFEVGDSGPDFFPKVPMAFSPYRHQEEAFRRLGGAQKKNTLVATGTGSGKTESFLYPILAHCEAHQDRPGIKAILIYPMNALAQDQAERIARLIDGNENLRNKVRVGLYVGSEGDEVHSQMGPNHVITDKNLLRADPPDILLTNYKMLDYLLIRPRDQVIWHHNAPQTLQFLVVDELHTFDGAQGTDLASLIRRLKARLKTPEIHLTCVGTSATLGDSPESLNRLLGYAEEVFGQSFEKEAVIREARVSKDIFLDAGRESRRSKGESEQEIDIIPGEHSLPELDPTGYQEPEAYVARQQLLWFQKELDRVELGEALKEHFFLERLLVFLRERPRSLDHLVEKLRRETDFSGKSREYVEAVLISFLSLIAHARDTTGHRPFLYLRVELWQREMRRMVASVRPSPRLTFHDDLDREHRKNHLPVVYCRECGTMGWATMIDKDRPFQISSSLQKFYQAYFGYDDRVAFFFPPSTGMAGMNWYLNSQTLERQQQPPAERKGADEENPWFPVVFPETTRKTQYGLRSHRDCPACEAKESLSLLGFQAASLTSAFINQLFASRFNDDKKLLTFSDSVQDAAHRAGFFEARTWRFNLRIAIQKVVDDVGADLALSELPGEVVSYWRKRLGDTAFVGTFIAPDMVWLGEYQEMIEKEGFEKLSKKQRERLLDMVSRRVFWEVVSEYSFQAPIGRTLPRTGASLAYVEPERVEEAIAGLVEPLRNEIGGLQKLTAEHLRPLVTGLLRRLLMQGAIFHEEIHESYLSSGGEKIFVMSQKMLHLPNFSPKSRLPVFLASRSGTARFEALSHRQGQSWYERYFARVMERLGGLVADEAPYALRMVLDELVKAGVLERRTYGGTHLWGFRLDVLRVTNAVTALKESATGSIVNVPEHEKTSWLVTPALGPQGGAHEVVEGGRADYYRRLYKDGDVVRIVAEEHTGLLTRGAREEVEREFKSREPRPWYPNLLSCTPTLEMGIDVGDLSTAILCSVPPSQANYLQRIGRAGRRDGNSLLITLASARDHDIYFFLEPEEMIAGHVATPGVFLNASAVLERQLTAFAFDCWAGSGVGAEELPPRLGDVLNALDSKGTTRFPHNLIAFIQEHGQRLLADFQALFAEHLTDQTGAYLARFVIGDEGSQGPLVVRILDAFQEALRDRRKHDHARQEMDRALKRLKEEPVLGEDQKKEIEAIEEERKATTSLIAQINSRDTMEFLTTQGLLPNYAFPEAGVTLQSVIWRKRTSEERDDKQYVTFKYEFERPASAAIREFAPRNYFYAGGRQVEIDRIAVDRDQIESWQFCDVCHYAEKVQEKSDRTSCPKCRSEGFGNAAGQIYKMVRLRQVYANTHDKVSRIGDDAEERRPRFYNRRMLVTTAGKGQESWVINDETLPFGYEYVTRTRFREINFGEYTDDGEVGKNGRIAGSEEVRQGFEICADCGMVQPEKHKREKGARHSFGCVSRRRNHREKIEDCLFLYRDFDAESIHLLLPFANRPGYETKLHSFVAAFQLGMREFFGGQVDHLEATDFTDQGPENSGMRQFLVLYDRIPGGTGYLKDLMRPTAENRSKFFVIFEGALEILTSCSCNADPAKDGCYRCLYAYRNSFDMPETSRDTAVEILSELLEAEDKLEQIESLETISVSGLLDSALEARLLEALAGAPRTTLKKDLVRGRSGYRFQNEAMKWEILPQVEKSTSDGLAAKVSIDFVFHPGPSQDRGRPIAVFTDGFQFHKSRIGHDFFQRMALAQAEQAHPFSLTWADIDSAISEPGDGCFSLVDPRGDETGKNLFEMLSELFGASSLVDCVGIKSMELLGRFLTMADGESRNRKWQGFAMALAASVTRPLDFVAWKEELARYAPATLFDVVAEAPIGKPMVRILDGPEGATPVKIFISFDQSTMGTFAPEGIRILVWLDDSPEQRERMEFRKTWNGVLRLFNVFQFLPNAFFIASSMAGNYDFGALINSRPTLTGAAWDIAEAHEWKALRDEVAIMDPAFGVLVDELYNRRCPLAQAGFVILDERGREASTPAELAWPEHKLALLEFGGGAEDETSRQEYESRGWTVLDIHAVVDDPDLVLAHLGAND